MDPNHDRLLAAATLARDKLAFAEQGQVKALKKLRRLRERIAIHGPWSLDQALDRVPTKVTYDDLRKWVKHIDAVMTMLKAPSHKVSSVCLCGHARLDHIYEEGPCRPGFVCAKKCQRFRARLGAK